MGDETHKNKTWLNVGQCNENIRSFVAQEVYHSLDREETCWEHLKMESSLKHRERESSRFVWPFALRSKSWV
uniref:Uncharacterized protein n=1 Tax=Octopus bimaculoides TaxID=37653 RepID=A0A0L8HTV9_OCTBM